MTDVFLTFEQKCDRCGNTFSHRKPFDPGKVPDLSKSSLSSSILKLSYPELEIDVEITSLCNRCKPVVDNAVQKILSPNKRSLVDDKASK